MQKKRKSLQSPCSKELILKNNKIATEADPEIMILTTRSTTPIKGVIARTVSMTIAPEEPLKSIPKPLIQQTQITPLKSIQILHKILSFSQKSSK